MRWLGKYKCLLKSLETWFWSSGTMWKKDTLLWPWHAYRTHTHTHAKTCTHSQLLKQITLKRIWFIQLYLLMKMMAYRLTVTWGRNVSCKINMFQQLVSGRLLKWGLHKQVGLWGPELGSLSFLAAPCLLSPQRHGNVRNGHSLFPGLPQAYLYRYTKRLTNFLSRPAPETQYIPYTSNPWLLPTFRRRPVALGALCDPDHIIKDDQIYEKASRATAFKISWTETCLSSQVPGMLQDVLGSCFRFAYHSCKHSLHASW